MRPIPGRRALLALLAGGWSLAAPGARNHPAPPLAAREATAVPGRVLQFPRDHASHPEFRIEWWYITGWLQSSASREFGVQITFFRAKPRLTQGNQSAFTPEHIIIAHAALADPAYGRLRHSQRAARAVFDLAGAGTDNIRVWLDDWQLSQRNDVWMARIVADEFTLDLRFTATQPLLLQGIEGYSRKGPEPQAASHYYSAPQLQVSGSVRGNSAAQAVSGRAWLDHEWSSSYLPDGAVGWDWIGINLDDGGALMAFRMRGRGENSVLWAAATRRDASGRRQTFSAEAVQFLKRREWQSPRTGIPYPVSFDIRIADLKITLEPLFDDQENDTRATTGAIYWEGAVRATVKGRGIGRGYLELTGYGEPLQL